MKCHIDTDELYPVYCIVDAESPSEAWRNKGSNPRPPIDIPDDVWARYQAARKEFNAVQDILDVYSDTYYAWKSEP